MTEVRVQFHLPWRKEELVVALPDTGACVEDALAPIMDVRSRTSAFTVLNGRVCYASDPVAAGDYIQVLPIIGGG